MRRFGRIFFLFASAVSLLLCVIAAGLWVWSYFAIAWLARYDGVYERHAVASSGQLQILMGQDTFAAALAQRPSLQWNWLPDAPYDLSALVTKYAPPGPRPVGGFLFRRFNWTWSGLGATLVIVPFWLIVIPTALLPLSAALSMRRRRRAKRRLSAGCCPHCGYDCRATPGRCPECGRDFATGVAVRR